MKASRYNLLCEDDEYVYLANTLSRSSVRLSRDHGLLIRLILERLSSQAHIPRELDPLLQLLHDGGFVVAAGYDELSAAVARYEEARKSTDSLELVVAPTMGCNMSCFYCYEQRRDVSISELTADRIISFARERAEGAKAIVLHWHGGEPLLAVEQVLEITARLRDIAAERNASFRSDMVTNGALLDENTARRLAAVGVSGVQITFDGARNRHNRVRRLSSTSDNRNSFDLILSNLIAAKSLLRFALRINVYKKNADEIHELIDELASRGIQDFVSSLYFAPIFSYTPRMKARSYEPMEGVHFSNREFAALEVSLVRHAREKGFSCGDFLSGSPGCVAVRENAYVIDADGTVKKCYHDLSNSGAAFATLGSPLQDAAQLDPWLQFRPEADEFCRDCKLLPICYSSCPHKIFSGVPRPELCPPMKFNWDKMLPFVHDERAS